MKIERNIFYWMIIIGIILSSCVKDKEFDAPDLECSDADFTFISISELKNMYNGETIQIQEDLVINGYVISSDKEGNFFNIIHFQDEPSNPSDGMQIELELRDAHLFFDVGQQIIIKLKGLYLGKSNDTYKIGGVFTSFGNRSVGRLPKNVVFDHVLVSCEPNDGIEPTLAVISGLNDAMLNTLVVINSVEIKQEELGKTFAVKEEETLRTLVDCMDNELVMVNSGYADFQSESLPDKMGNATGLLTKDNNQFQLIIRGVNDLEFEQERCEDFIDEFTSPSIFISEIADPDNNAGARFVELYNASEESLSLKGWSLERFTNDNTAISSSIDLSEYEIPGRGFLIISPNSEEFKNVYGFDADIAVGTNSPADSNGDDTIVLVDPFGNIIDIFGVIGEDGSNTNHEFEDGAAVRKLGVVSGNPVFTASEWTIYNDTGDAGTINQPQNAPLDFSPGMR
ncbi:DUF5689 domain-containing protein [Maribacter sp. 1_MG-2023]|uniref:DUF5689 domain-containing protein n=1 Tax=Maribacter sp. 1_MG-2023 TaxID=3062677 RepID=UPI0026E36B9F|nr:DUF5689 domain-containing protein [Maribacter sp. 1_MG-2023]MDO6471225.1 DUF5689 domain-containing protein [Maribacter sp. 1_MG-2023]